MGKPIGSSPTSLVMQKLIFSKDERLVVYRDLNMVSIIDFNQNDFVATEEI